VSAARDRGTAAETAVVRYLQEYGFPFAERRALSGVKDRGDIAGLDHVVIEVKDQKALRLAEFVDEATVEARNAGGFTLGVVWHKRPGRGNPRDWYVTMTGDVFLEFLVCHQATEGAEYIRYYS
jgi:hypothetical protein